MAKDRTLALLGRLGIDPDLAILVEAWPWDCGGGMAARSLLPYWVMSVFSGLVEAIPSSMLPWPVGDGNWVNLKSVEADSKLLCKSSKLTEGRKSNEIEVFSFTWSAGGCTPFLPKENKEWLFEEDALSIGESEGARSSGLWVTGLWLVFLLGDRRSAGRGPAGAV